MTPTFRQATPADHPILLLLMRDFYAEDHLTPPPNASATLADLLATPHLAQAHLPLVHDTPAGYFLLAFMFSLERGGKCAFLDELYIAPPFRNQGLGRACIDHAIHLATAAQCTTLLLEVQDQNSRARALYERAGFTALPRRLMLRPLVP